MKRYYWENFDTEQLLDIRLCDLGLRVEEEWLTRYWSPIERILKRRGITTFNPHFWVSDEWFCPDGIPGVAIAFFCLHPRLRKLERDMIGYVEGCNGAQVTKYLRHEVGHAFDNAFALRGAPGRGKLFGSPQLTYPKSYDSRPYSKEFVHHLGAGYGQSHPDEDFAETFAVWLGPKAKWSEKYRGTLAGEKLWYMDNLVRKLKGVQTDLSNRRVSSPIHRQWITLREYYRRKKIRKGLAPRRKVDEGLIKIGRSKSTRRKRQNLDQLIRRNRSLLLRELSNLTGKRQYCFDELILQLESRSRVLNIQAFGAESQIMVELLRFATDQAKELSKSRRRTFIM